MTCRTCGSQRHRRSHRSPVERLMTAFVPLRRFRCLRCGRRRWGLKRPLGGRGPIGILLPR